MEFNRIITLLRKERGITQKQAAQDLGVSQALLSHYEKGIRECGLEFVVKVADYYGVSCDYLLGRSAERSGQTISVLPTMNKKLIANSLNILYDKLGASRDKGLVTEVSGYLMLAVYKMFRLVYMADPKNAASMFSVTPGRWEGYSTASMLAAEANIKSILSGEDQPGAPALKDPSCFGMTTETLTQNYPLYATSLLNLIKTSEKRIEHQG